MKTTLYFNDKKITKKAAIEMIGKERVEKFIRESKEDFMEDPNFELSWFIGHGMLRVEFS